MVIESGADKPPISAKGLAFAYPKERHAPARYVLEGVSLDVERAEFVSLLGPNAVGKTTLLRMLAHELEPSAGEIKWFGCGKFSASVNKRVAFLRQSYPLIPWLTVRQNIAYALKCRRRSKKELEDALAHITDKTGISAHLSKRPCDLSGGWRQRAALAQILALQPNLLLLDEPASAADIEGQRKMAENLLAEIQRRTDDDPLTVLEATHDVRGATLRSDRVIVLLPRAIGEPGGVHAQFRPARDPAKRQIEADRIIQAVSLLFVDRGESALARKTALAAETSIPDDGRVLILALEARREYTHQDPDSFFQCVCHNLRRGVVYSYMFPDNRDVLTLCETFAREVGAATVCRRLRIRLNVSADVFRDLGDCVVLEVDGVPRSGWRFPLPYNYHVLFPLADDQLISTWERLAPLEGAPPTDVCAFTGRSNA